MAAGAPRVASLGEWPAHIDPASLTSRIPEPDERAGGFDAGVACALDLIPRDGQELSARFHGAYTPDAVARARAELTRLEAEHQTAWWLAACAVCEEGEIDQPAFLRQIATFDALAADPSVRLEAARSEAALMRERFEVVDGLALARADGGMQGAYLAGHEIAAGWAEHLGLYFLGTFHPSLGLEDFAWSQPPDPEAGDREARLGRSGPVHGSAAFVKCADADELARAHARARAHLLRSTAA
ncbi:hypothetical protein [Miltoncostaea oceani]|uniref:hypothetical protein n=1 Tax=Miltoncostaea oceani TaxID=2843216 RepID=UPI001C3C2387|nr:hypothetical protein [Miltoncostaea oceani]